MAAPRSQYPDPSPNRTKALCPSAARAIFETTPANHKMRTRAAPQLPDASRNRSASSSVAMVAENESFIEAGILKLILTIGANHSTTNTAHVKINRVPRVPRVPRRQQSEISERNPALRRLIMCAENTGKYSAGLGRGEWRRLIRAQPERPS